MGTDEQTDTETDMAGEKSSSRQNDSISNFRQIERERERDYRVSRLPQSCSFIHRTCIQSHSVINYITPTVTYITIVR